MPRLSALQSRAARRRWIVAALCAIGAVFAAAALTVGAALLIAATR